VSAALALARVFLTRMMVTASELELQTLIASVLTEEGIAFDRERRLGAAGVIDFYVPAARVGIEVKVDGSPAFVRRQLMRYAGSAEISELLLVTTRAPHLSLRGGSLQGKSLHVVQIVGGL
jgi:hypothetical protein